MTGYVTHPDPLTAIVNAHQFDPADEIVISTLPSYGSNWLRGDLINRARRATGVPVEHVTSESRSASSCTLGDGLSGIRRIAHAHGLATTHHGPPEAQPQLAGSPAAARACCCSSSPRRCCSGRSSRPCSSSASCRTRRSRREPFEFPVTVAALNTAVLVSSSGTMHYALHSIKHGNRLGLQLGLVATFFLGADLPLHPDERVLQGRLRDPRRRLGVGLLRPHGPARARTSSSG